jgi:hypothetical protein
VVGVVTGIDSELDGDEIAAVDCEGVATVCEDKAIPDIVAGSVEKAAGYSCGIL